MTPGSPSSPLETLQQLRAMLDAGTLSQAEFEALKQQLVFGAGAGAPAPSAADLPVVPVAVAAEEAAETSTQAAAALPTMPPAAFAPPAAPASAVVPDTFVVDSYEAAATSPPTNYLSLTLSIGGLLLLFGLVLYLAANRHPSERIDSTSLTAADSTAVVEVGPQATPLPPVPVAAPETLRLAPTNPAPPVQRPARPMADSTAARPQADSI